MKYIKVPKDTYDSMVLLMAELKEDNRELELTRLRNERDIESLKRQLGYTVDDLPKYITHEFFPF